MDTELKHRVTVLTFAVGILATLVVANIGMVFTLWQSLNVMSYQLGNINGQLTIMTGHVVLK